MLSYKRGETPKLPQRLVQNCSKGTPYLFSMPNPRYSVWRRRCVLFRGCHTYGLRFLSALPKAPMHIPLCKNAAKRDVQSSLRGYPTWPRGVGPSKSWCITGTSCCSYFAFFLFLFFFVFVPLPIAHAELRANICYNKQFHSQALTLNLATKLRI